MVQIRITIRVDIYNQRVVIRIRVRVRIRENI